jgi:hypothetical protein
MELSRNAGANKPRMESKNLTYAKEVDIFAHPLRQLNSSKSVQKHILVHCMSKFLICGWIECHNLHYNDFTRGVNEIGVACVE